MSTKYAVLGAGNAGFAFAGHAGLNGFEVNLYEDKKFAHNLDEVSKKGGIYLKDNIKGFGRIAKTTYNIEEAVKKMDIIIIAVPEFAQKTIFENYIKYAEDGQIVVFFPGNYASFKFKKLVEEYKKDIIIAEASSSPYGARKKEPGSVDIIGLKYKLHIASIPCYKSVCVVEKLNEFFDIFVPGKNVLEVSLNNPNFISHCVATALNAGWVESTKGNFSLYWQGMSPSVCNVMQAVDAERLAVASEFECNILSDIGFYEEYYGITGNSLYEIIQKSKNHGNSGAPKSLFDRYIEEDAPAGLAAVVALGELADISTPVCQAILTICSALNKKDYYSIGLNARNLGIEKMTRSEVIEYIS